MAAKTALRARSTVAGEPKRVTYIRGKLSSKGQITLPVEVRKRLGLHEGDQVDFIFEKGRTVLRPVRSEENPFAKWVGAARRGLKSDAELEQWHREMRGYDEWDEKDLAR